LTLAAKLVVTASKGGSRIALVGASGKELLTSVVFSEPRAKGATLRSLKGLLGEDIVVEDQTLSSSRGRGRPAESENGSAPKPVKKRAARSAAKGGTRPATKRAGRRAAATSEAAVDMAAAAVAPVKSAVKSAKNAARSAAKSVKSAATS
jgi:hypothetical protein